MTRELDRAGIFKAMPITWLIREGKDTSSVSIAIEYVIISQLDGKEWASWTDYEEHRCWGNHCVVKADGTPNVVMVQLLAAALGWEGNLNRITSGPPPQVVVQITVKADTYKGKTSFKADWINPEDFVPGPGGASEQEVGQLDARFGSLLRAAASGVKKPGAPARGAPAAKAPPPAAKPAPAPAAATKTYPQTGDEIPF